MTVDQKPRKGGPGAFSRWFQLKMNARTNDKIRRRDGKIMGMDLLILHTVGARSEQPRQSPLAWFGEDGNSWLVVASGGGDRNPDWYTNLMAHPDRASVEMHGGTALPVAVQPLDGADQEHAWQRIAAEQPRIAKYQARSERRYPVVRLTAR